MEHTHLTDAGHDHPRMARIIRRWTLRLLANYWLYVSLIACIVILFSLLQTTSNYRIEQGAPLAEDGPRMVMFAVKSTRYDSNGQIGYTVSADGVAQFTDGTLSANNPVMAIYGNDGEPQTFLRSRRGDFHDGVVGLHGNVAVTTTSVPGLLVGETLQYDQKNRTARITNPRIRLIANDRISFTTADQLTIHIDDRHAQLNGRVASRITRANKE